MPDASASIVRTQCRTQESTGSGANIAAVL